MSPVEITGHLLGIERLESVESIEPSFAAPWAAGGPAWVVFGCAALLAAAFVFYLRFQRRGRRRVRLVLALARGLLLSLLFLFLAEPVAVVKLASLPRPRFWLLFDATDSMAIEDELSASERLRLERAVGAARGEREGARPTGGTGEAAGKRSRMDYVRSFLAHRGDALLERLDEKFRVQAFSLRRPDGVQALDLARANGTLDGASAASGLDPSGEVTALGAAFLDLSRRHAEGRLAGLLVVSDFGQNSGPPALASAEKLGVPVHTLGVGPAAATDLAVGVEAPLLLKKSERTFVEVRIRQSGLEGRTVDVELAVEPLVEGSGDAQGPRGMTLGTRAVELGGESVEASFPFTPEETGRFRLVAAIEPLEGESLDQNNRAEREVTIRDDFLRVLFVEYEPTWEWRFIKEVFHRDRLVGLRGFRTFLRSADPRVRHTNELFLPTLTPPRNEFFATDVIFLGDMPASALSGRFGEMTREFVSEFGGGLVVIGGPRFGPGELLETPIGDMLPVIPDREARVWDEAPFRPRLTAEAAHYDFMQLGEDEKESAAAWRNLGELPWFRPVARLHPLGTALLEHPRETCVDGETPQPLIATRRYGSGEVVYVGFNETWRLRRAYGELYYRQFWGQLIHRLGLSHALGAHKRFVVRTDRQRYSSDDTVMVTVEAYDENFEPLGEAELEGGGLEAELLRPAGASEEASRRAFRVPERREGLFEARVPVYAGGEHRLRVRDPLTGEVSEVAFEVTDLSVERRSAVRNVGLEREIATATGGKRYDFESVRDLPDEVEIPETRETRIEVVALWNTWLAFALVLALMLGEWFFRKLVNLP